MRDWLATFQVEGADGAETGDVVSQAGERGGVSGGEGECVVVAGDEVGQGSSAVSAAVAPGDST